ncbi:PepSY domain-containing protein [Streptomyces niveus]|uniref:PepSY domain-containing protein n=1 Tax=Streptomyces niveus TaxID=193462 RepID=UPI0036825211
MKRNLVIAGIVTAALIGGGTFTAVAGGATDTGGSAPESISSASLVKSEDDGGRDDNGDDDNGGFNGNGKDGTSGTAAKGPKITAEQAAAAALGQHPGKVESVELDDDDDDDGSSAARHWEVDVIGKDGKWYDLRVDAATGAVRADNDDDDDNDDDRHERALVNGADVDARGAAAAALKKHPGAVTSVESDDDDRKAGHWEVTVRGDDGAWHAVTVDMTTGAVAADRDDDRDDDRGDDHGDDDGKDDDGHHDDRGGDDDGDDD